MWINRRRGLRIAAFVLGISFSAIVSNAQQVFSNGPVASVPGGGAGGKDASRLQTSLGLDSLGFSVGLTGSSLEAAAEDFTVPAPGWNVSRIRVFAYQTDSGLTSPINDMRFVIMSGRPDLPGSTVVAGNPAINALSSTSFTNIYRDAQSSPGGSRRPIMAAVANVNIKLGPGTYWLVWALGGALGAAGPFVPTLTIPGATTTGNALQLCTCSGWGPALDEGTQTPQGLPFEIEGNLSVPSTLTVGVNSPALHTGNRLTLSAALTPGSGSADAYFLIDVPGGGTLSLTSSGGLVPGFVPFARGFVPFAFSGVLLDLALPPVPFGTYTFRGVLTVAGTATQISASQVTFTVSP